MFCVDHGFKLNSFEFHINLRGARSMNLLKFAILAMAAFGSVASCTRSPTPNTASNPTRTPVAATPQPTAATDELAAAKEIYAINCMICHKDTGKGGKMTQDGKTINPDDLTTAKMKAMTDEKLNGYVTNGIEDEGMPAFKGKLTTDEIKSVIRHVRTLQN